MLWKKVKLLKMSNFTFSHNIFYEICILKSFNPFPEQAICFTCLSRTLWEKKKFTCKKQFLLFPQCFLPVQRAFCHINKFEIVVGKPFHSLEESKICRLGTFKVSSAASLNLGQSQNGILGNGLRLIYLVITKIFQSGYI